MVRVIDGTLQHNALLYYNYIYIRRYGGIQLHADRFKHINNVARILLQDSGAGLQVRTCIYIRAYKLPSVPCVFMMRCTLQHKEAAAAGKKKHSPKLKSKAGKHR